MFHFPSLSPFNLYIQLKVSRHYSRWVVPFGNLRSKIVCISPKLIAAYHVLHRLYMPRHPPYTHSNLTYTFLISLCSTDRQYYLFNLCIYNITLAVTFIFILTNHVKKQKKKFCGADRDRTCDPRVANAMLSQLSYSP